MTGRRALKAYNPTAALVWAVAKWTCLALGASALGASLGIAFGDWVRTGDWQVTGTTAAVAFIGVPCGVLGTLFHALRAHAIDGPPWTPQGKCSECGAGPGSRCPTYCSQWEPTSDWDDDVLSVGADYDDLLADDLPDPWDAGEAWKETT